MYPEIPSSLTMVDYKILNDFMRTHDRGLRNRTIVKENTSVPDYVVSYASRDCWLTHGKYTSRGNRWKSKKTIGKHRCELVLAFQGCTQWRID